MPEMKIAELLFNRIISEYAKPDYNDAKIELLFELLIEELNINIDNLDCFDATVLNYDNFTDYYNSELI